MSGLARHGAWPAPCLVAALTFAGCGGSGSSGPATSPPPPPPPPQAYTVGASVNGLSSTGLVLQLNGANDLAISSNGSATFGSSLASGSAYAVTVGTQPAGETCTVTNGSGTMGAADVTAPVVSCTPNSTPQYTVTVNVAGLAAGPTLVLQLDGIAQLAITANGSATFSPLLGTGENYVVTVLTQPTPPPTQTCTIANGSGTIGTANITNVNVTCTTTYSVSALVYNHWGSGLVLQLNGGDDTPIVPTASGDSNVRFTTRLPAGASYVITVKTQPTRPTQTCTVSGGSGTIAAANVFGSVYCGLVYVVSAKSEWTSMPWIGLDVGSCGASATAAPSAGPVARGNGVSWTDTAGDLWIFGGYWLDPLAAVTGSLNDVWKYNPGAGAWTCVNGGGTASFGTKGVASPSNLPPAGPGASWFDGAGGKLWLFGDLYNALWRYDLGSNIWTWVGGSSTQRAGAVYGAQGTPALANVPGARGGSASWIDHSGNLWMFGGFDGTPSANDFLNDLWEYNPNAALWVWVAGSVAGTQGAGPKGVYGTKGTGSSNNVPGGRRAVVTWADSAGNLWLFGGIGIDSKGTTGQLNDLWKYTPSTTFGALGTWTWIGGSDTASAVGVYGTKGNASAANIPGARSAAAAWTDLTGDFWLFGGFGCTTACGDGPNAVLGDFWRFSPAAGTWAWMSGPNTPGSSPGAGTPGIPAPGNNPGGRWGSTSWTDPSGNLWLFGGTIYGIQPFYLNDFWVYTPQ